MVGLGTNVRNLLGDQDDQTADDVFEELKNRIIVLNARVWENRIDWQLVERWLANFDGSSGFAPYVEKLHALFLLSQFLYFGSIEIRVLLRALYRDLFLVPAIQEVRSINGGTRDELLIERGLQTIFSTTRFLGVGTPSESGVHLLYYFRQENRLRKSQFLDTAQILERDEGSPLGRRIRYADVKRYIFVDDVCGSGETAYNYSKDHLEDIRRLDPEAQFFYYSMFAKKDGLELIRKHTAFRNNVAAVFEFDESYKCLSPSSRYLRVVPPQIDPDTVRRISTFYGARLLPADPTGFDDGQMLIGFHHNTPDNTLPIIWMDPENDSPVPWCAIFRRYPKA